jgi:multidrug efflux pump subunit AcrA (membrane-fusion protein)
VPIRVKSIHPKTGPDLAVGVEQPANIAPYYRADLFAKVAGTVTFLEKDMGHTVAKGEKVVVIEPVQGTPADVALGELRAPFVGVIAARAVDVGTFVPSAMIVPGAMPIVTIVRTDIVTVAMRVPDTVAQLVGKDTEVELRMDSVSGAPIRCKITRISPALSPSDRTLRVEIDIYNGTPAEFRAFVAQSEQSQHADLKGRELPQLPKGLAEGSAARLIPGSYGRMQLVVKRFAETPLIPSAAIVRQGGVPYLYRVEAGVARRARIAVDIDDGTLARVVWIESADGKDIRRELRTDEEIVVSNQGELDDGQRVSATLQ